MLRNSYVMILVMVATASIITIQRSVIVQQGDTLFFWLLYFVGVSWALLIVAHRST